MKKLICLGVESTAHSFSVGIVNSQREILSLTTTTYKPKTGYGYIPHEVAHHHAKNWKEVLEKALKLADVEFKDIDIVAISLGPGLPPCLHVGLKIAREICKDKPLVGVNHCIAHVEIGKLLTNAKDPVTCYVSGGNTQILAYQAGKYRVFGETLDIPLGNALDMLSKEMGFEVPGGPIIEQLAKKGSWVDLPLSIKGMDVSFTGTLSAALRKFKAGYKPEDIAFSFQEVCFAVLTEVTERALAHLGKDEVLLTGGVAANVRFQEMMKIMCLERGAEFHVVPKPYAGDNGAMIAWVGILAYSSQEFIDAKKAGIKPNWRVDEVAITWIK